MKPNHSNHRSTAASLTLLALTAGSALAQTTTIYSGANGASNSDTWNNVARWSAGIPTDPAPSAPWDVQIADNWHAGVATAAVTPVYTGNLTLGAGSQLTIGEGSGINGLRALGTGNITFNTGSRITLRWSTSSTHSQNFIMAGNATFGIGSSTAAHNDDRTLTGVISGAGQMSVASTNGQRLTIQNNNPLWSGGIIMGGALSENKNEGLRANSAGAFGTGNVTVNDGVGLLISVADAIGDAATLSLSGGDGEELFKLNMAAADTVDRLLVDGYPQLAGTYGALASAATYKRAWITGASLLTVSTAPTDITAPTVIFGGTGAGGSTSSVYNTEPVTYTITFSEPHSPALTAADLENSTATPVTIGSVTPLPLTGGMTTVSYRVVVTPNAAGTLNLQIKSGTVINDLFGNALVVPAADNDTLTVDALPAIEGELGVWKPWANNRINPATGLAWAVGDTYRLALKTSTTSTATSTDIATYNAFVQGVAAASVTYPDLGNGTWKVIGSTATVSAAVNTGTNAGTGVSVILMDGSTLFATNNTDLWNGTAARPDVAGTFLAPYINQNGVDDGLDDSIFTGTNTNGTSHPTQPLGGAPTNVNGGKARPNNSSRWMVQFNSVNTGPLKFFALSNPLTLQAIGGAPEIAVEQPAATDIANAGSKDFGTVTIGSNNPLTFTIRNTGSGALNLDGSPLVDITGANAGDFTVTATPTTPVASGGGTTTFTIQFAPSASGARSAALSIASDDGDEDPFVINLTGTGQTAYQAWATGSEPFDGDANGDGVQDGLAFLLGAAAPGTDASGLLPTVTEDNGDLILTFDCLPVVARGSAQLRVAYSNTLASFTAATDVVPNTTGPDVGGVVSYVVTGPSGSPSVYTVVATIDSSAAGGGKLFGRLQATE